MPSNVHDIIAAGDLGGGLIPTEYATQIIQDAPKASVSLTRMRQVPMSTRTRVQPVLDSKPIAYWVGGDTGLKQTTKMKWSGVTITTASDSPSATHPLLLNAIHISAASAPCPWVAFLCGPSGRGMWWPCGLCGGAGLRSAYRSRPCGACDPFGGSASCLACSVAIASIGAWREARRHGARIKRQSAYCATRSNHGMRQPRGITHRTTEPLHGARISGKTHTGTQGRRTVCENPPEPHA